MSFNSIQSTCAHDSTIWRAKSWWPHENLNVPQALAKQNNTEVLLFEQHISAVILPTFEPSGFGEYPLRDKFNVLGSELNYLHIFNCSDFPKTISGIVDGVAFKDVKIPANKRVILEKNEQHFQRTNWKEMSWWPHNNLNMPYELADQNKAELKLFEKDIYGVVLSSFEPLGFSGYSSKSTVNSTSKFLHLFNSADHQKVISGQVDGVQFTDICVPANKRVILALV